MRLSFLTAGESHGPGLITILEGLPAGIPIHEQQINAELARRQKGFGAGPRMKIEKDKACVISGVMEGITIGSPVALLIKNTDHEKWRGKKIPPFTIPRPGHADLTGLIKYGYPDLRPALERASARETAARVAVGAIVKKFLGLFGIHVGGYVVTIGEVEAELGEMAWMERIQNAEKSVVRCPSELASKAMEARIRQVMEEKDTLGGILEAVVLGLPPGLGSYVHWERRLDARLAGSVMSIQAFKGVEIGHAFKNSQQVGSRVQDEIYLQDRKLVRQTNYSGGLEGGITNGEPLLIRAAMKPIATTLNPQKSVNLKSGEEVDTHYERSDFCPVPRAVPILEAVIAVVIADALLEKLGGDSISEMMPRFKNLRRSNLDDLKLDGEERLFWSSYQDLL